MEIVKSYMNHFSDPPKTVHKINNRLLGTLTANPALKCIHTNIDFQTLTDTAVAPVSYTHLRAHRDLSTPRMPSSA